MKYVITALVMIFLLAVLLRDKRDEPEAADPALANTQWQMADYFRGDEEPTTKGARWTAKNTFVVGVINDGSRQDGYAEYVCAVLNEFSLDRTTVYVIDHNNMAHAENTVVLGRAYCN